MRLSAFLASLFLSVLALDVLAASAADQAHLQQLWKATNMSLAYLEANALNKSVCLANDVNFYGCVKAIDVLLFDDKSKAPASLTTVDLLKISEDYQAKNHVKAKTTVLQDFGYYKIVSLERINTPKDEVIDPSADPDTDTELVNLKTFLKQEISYWHQAFASQSTHAVPLDDILVWISKNSVTSANEAYKAGQAYNEFTAMARDAHGYFLPEAYYREEEKNTSNQFVGIGVAIRPLGSKIICVEPYEGYPGYKAGIRANDVILTVNGKSVDGLNSADVADMIRGPAGTQVTLELQRGNQKVTYTMTREKIVSKVVDSKLLITPEKGSNQNYKVGYIKVRDFVADTMCKDMADSINELQGKGAEALIVDLRGNPGGNVEYVACALGLFIGEGQKVVTIKTLKGQILSSTMTPTAQDVQKDPTLTPVGKIAKVPVVTLVNASSASASEIFAGDMQDYGASVIAGTRSYGKGSVQGLGQFRSMQLFSSPTASLQDMLIAQTKGLYYLAGNANKAEHSPQVVGVVPELEVYGRPNPTEADKFALREEDNSPIILTQNNEPTPVPNATIVSYYKDCTAKNGLAAEEYKSGQGGQVLPDYQRFMALDAAVCAIHATPAATTNSLKLGQLF